MLLFALRRTGLACAIIFCAIALLFGMIYLVPGDPANVALGPLATPEIKAAFRAQMGLDKPVVTQFLIFLGHVFTGDLGLDLFSNRRVTAIVFEALPYTIALAACGIGWAIALGIPLGCWSAIRRDTWLDRITGVLAVAAIAVPAFVVALYALLLFAVELNWFPAIGAGARGNLGDQLAHLVLPSFAIGLGWVGYLARLVRASMLEVQRQDFMRTAHAKGLHPFFIQLRHALRNALIPVTTVAGMHLGNLLGGAVVIESLFGWPGMGRLALEAVLARDFSVLLGVLLLSSLLVILANMAIDLLHAWLDPRIGAT
jgi:peptide/nickel transport system permease protein